MKELSHLLSDSIGMLSVLRQHTYLIQRFQQLLSVNLPTSLNQHCYIANLRGTTVVVYVDSGLWATRLRYLVPEILKHWRQESSALALPMIDQIEVKVRPPFFNK